MPFPRVFPIEVRHGFVVVGGLFVVVDAWEGFVVVGQAEVAAWLGGLVAILSSGVHEGDDVG